MQDEARVQKSPSPYYSGPYRKQLFALTTKRLEQLELQHQVTLRALEGRSPTSAQIKSMTLPSRQIWRRK